MNNQFLRKFNELTDNKFSYIKLSQVNVNVAQQTVEVVLLYPMDQKKAVDENYDEIRINVVRAAKIQAKPIITLKGSEFDFEYAKRLLYDFFRNYPTVAPFILPDNFSYEVKDGRVYITLSIESSAAEYCKERDLSAEIAKYLDLYFTDKITFVFEPMAEDLSKLDDTIYDNSMPEYFLELAGGRFITPENVEEFIGKIVYDKAMYIEDCTAALAEQTITVCGTIDSIREIEREEKSSFMKLELTDFTSSISCLIFPNKYNPIDKLRMLSAGKEVVVKGTLKAKEFRGEQTLSMFVKNLSLCTLPKNFQKNEIIRKVAANYSKVFPVDYVEEKQSNFFDADKSEAIAHYLIGKQFVVFDFETTGLDTRICNITEIGAVKIVDGRITQTFSTLVNPLEKLSEKVIETTGITDDMLADQPIIDDIIPDFHKFCDGCILVGQNSNEFDLKILSRVASKFKLRFSEQHEDTMILARTHLKLRNCKLSNLAKYYGIINENAHRALDDAITTAKVFINLANFM